MVVRDRPNAEPSRWPPGIVLDELGVDEMPKPFPPGFLLRLEAEAKAQRRKHWRDIRVPRGRVLGWKLLRWWYLSVRWLDLGRSR